MRVSEKAVLPFNKYSFLFDLEREIQFATFPSFIFRALLGKELRDIVCIFKYKECSMCDLGRQCAYSYIFETHVEKDNNALKGRNRASHPFVISGITLNKKRVKLDLLLLGKGIDFFPYLFFALKKGGDKGLFRERIRYTVADVTLHGKSIINEDSTLNLDQEKSEWKLNSNTEKREAKRINIFFKTPFRLKKGGKYLSVFSYDDLLTSLSRRTDILTSFYGTPGANIEVFKAAPKNERPSLRWVDLKRYS
ncbi:MAG: hypothetical protein ACE5FU_14075, partial [Nitrospinota bacterium]